MVWRLGIVELTYPFRTLDNDGTPPNYDNQGMCSGYDLQITSLYNIHSSEYSEPTPPSSVPSPTEPSLSAQLPPSTQIKQELSESTSMLEYPSIASGSISSVIRRKKKRKARGVEERRKSLLDDPRCGEVQPGEVLCLMCRNWIKLYKDVPYIDANWTRHAERCQTRHGYAYSLLCTLRYHTDRPILAPTSRTTNLLSRRMMLHLKQL